MSGRPSHTFNSPIFGICDLVRQESPPGDETVIAYVSLPGRPERVVAAIWKDGRWCDRFERPLSESVETWYSIKPRGTAM